MVFTNNKHPKPKQYLLVFVCNRGKIEHPMKIKRNIYKTYQNTLEGLNHDSNEANKSWGTTIGLIITLSSSGLVLTTAFAKDLFPGITKGSTLFSFTYLAWILFFISIISGVVAKVEEAIVFGNSAREKEKVLPELLKKIAEGITVDEIELNETFLLQGNIYWGVASIDCFLIALLSLCSQFLSSGISFVIGNILIILINIYLFNIRKK